MIVAAALTFFADSGELDLPTNEAYAHELARCGAAVLLLGTAGEGATLTDSERLQLVRIHADSRPLNLTVVLPPSSAPRVVGAASAAAGLMHSPWPTNDVADLVGFHRATGGSWMLYSHPAQTALPLTCDLAERLVHLKARPAGAKVSKETPGGIGKLRRIVGPDFLLWDGTDRHIADSVTAGADAAVSQTVGALAVANVSHVTVQDQIDHVRPSGRNKLRALKSLATRKLGTGTTVTRA